MFLLAYIIFFTNIAFILRLIFSCCRVTEEGNHTEEDSSEFNDEDDELIRSFIINNKKRKRTERVSPSPLIPEEEDPQSKETTFYETF